MTAPAARPTVVIFDLGGVLIDWNPRYLYRKLFADEADMEHFLATVCTNDWNEEQDAGRPFEVAIAELIPKWPDKADLIRAFFDRWTEMLNGALEETVALLAELRSQGTPLYALTNWSAETFPVAQAQFDFLSWFDGIVVSGVEKMKKPDPRIYGCLFERYGVDPAQAVFIDDSARNIAAAREVGLHGIQFTSAEALRDELAQLGIL